MLAWADYDNDGDLDLATAGNSGTGQITRLCQNDGNSFSELDVSLPGVQDGAIVWGDIDDDGYLDMAISGIDNGSAYVGRIYRNVQTITNERPDPPSNFMASYDGNNNQITVSWDMGRDNGAYATPQKGLYYDIGMATITLASNPSLWVISPSTGSGIGGAYNQRLGTYPHGYRVAASTQAGFFIDTLMRNTTYYYKVRTVDTGLKKSNWSPVYSICTSSIDVTAPAGISNLTALSAGGSAVTLAWTCPGNDGTTGALSNALFRIKYSTVGVITSGNFDAPPSSYTVTTVDISTTTTALSYQSTTLVNFLNSTTYWFAIKTMDNVGNWSVWNSSADVSTVNNAAWFCINNSISPGKLTGLAAVTGTQIQLSWTAPGDDGYSGNVTGGMWRIDYSSVTNAPGGAAGAYAMYISSSFTQGATTYGQMITGLQPRTTYYFQMIARDGAGNWGTVWSSSASAVAGSFVALKTSLTGVDFCSMGWGDYDNDGDLDLALSGFASGMYVSRVYRNDGGSFVNASGATIDGVSYCSLSWGDYDNDGDIDIALSGTYDGTNSLSRVYRNDGGSFVSASGTSLTAVQQSSLSWGDYDNDGDLDLALSGGVNGSTSISRVYRNDVGSFVIVSGATIDGVFYSSLNWGDYDNDGDLDLALCGDYSGTSAFTRIYRNDAGGFPSVSGTTITGVYNGSLGWGDYDNDGDIDLALCGTYDGNNSISRIYRNDGGSFVNASGATIDGVYLSALGWGDYDNDGNIDLSLCGTYDGTNAFSRIYRNDAGSFVRTTSLPGVFYNSMSWGDYDNDGDLDLTFSGYTGSVNILYITQSLDADFGSVNMPPSPPSGMTAKYNYAVAKSTIAFKWDPGQYDTGKSSNSLCYQIVVATNSTTWDGTKFTSPSKFTFPWQNGSPLMGNYVRPAAKLWPGDSTVKHTIFYSTAAATLKTNTTYYWRVRTIGAGLRRSAWSSEYSICTTSADVTAPAGISNLTAVSGGSNAVTLSWTSPGDDGTTGALSNALFRIKYSTVGVITSGNFDAPPSSYTVTTVDISTTTTALSYQSTTLANFLNSTTYWFAIKTMDNVGNWSVWNSSGDVGTINTLAWYNVPSAGGNAPNTPAGLALYTSTTTWAALTAGSWTNYQTIVATFTLTDPDGADTVQYNIQFSTYADFSYNFVNSTAPETASLAQGATYYISPLLPDGTWYWRVRALDGDGYASAFASMTAVNGCHFRIDRTVPTAIATLAAVTGFDPGCIALSWLAPGDDGETGDITDGAYRVRYATYTTEAGDFWTDAAANWTDWQNKYQVQWDTNTTAGAVQTRALTGLAEGVTYYIRVWGRDKVAGTGAWDGNWSAISIGATTYAQAVLLDVNAQPDIALDLDAVATRTTKILASSFTVINTGNVQVKYRLQLTGVPAVWTVRETPGATAGYDQIKILALFTTMNPPGSADFTDDIATSAGGDIVRASTYDVATSSSFAIAAEEESVKGYACTVGAVRRLWFRFDAPWATAVITQQNLTVTVTAVQD